MFEDTVEWTPSPELLDLAQSVSSPSLTEVGLASLFGPRSDWSLNAGQVWRVRCDNIHLLAMIAKTEDSARVLVTPVTIEPTSEDEDSAVTLRDIEPFSTPLTIWKSLTGSMPTRFLDRPIAQLGTKISDWVVGAGALPDNFRAGSAPSLGGDVQIRAMIQDLVEEICDKQSWANNPEIEGVLSPSDYSEAVLDILESRLGIRMSAVLDIVDGKLSPTDEQVPVLREVMGGLPKGVEIPSELIAEIDHPRNFDIVTELRTRDQLSDGSARSFLATDLLRQAARQTGRLDIAWRERIDQWASARGISRNS